MTSLNRNAKATWTIGEVATQSGVPASTIRYYEQIGLLPLPTRLNGRRRYGEGIAQQLGVIRLAQAAGFSIAEIQALLHDFPADAPPAMRWQRFAHEKLDAVAAQMRSLVAMKALLEATLECRCATLEECGATQRG